MSLGLPRIPVLLLSGLYNERDLPDSPLHKDAGDGLAERLLPLGLQA